MLAKPQTRQAEIFNSSWGSLSRKTLKLLFSTHQKIKILFYVILIHSKIQVSTDSICSKFCLFSCFVSFGFVFKHKKQKESHKIECVVSLQSLSEYFFWSFHMSWAGFCQRYLCLLISCTYILWLISYPQYAHTCNLLNNILVQ